jgi:hypothetical protein
MKASYMSLLGFNLAILCVNPLLVSVIKLCVAIITSLSHFRPINLNKYYIITCTGDTYLIIQQLQVFISLRSVLIIDWVGFSVISIYLSIYVF